MKPWKIQRQGGQALVVFLGFAAAMIGMLLVTFNAGQVTNAKMRAMNAADASAYSGAVWEARSLNFQAYMNRAMVVNEVTIAQSVSLRSWIDYLARFISNINVVTEFIPYAGEVTIAISRALDGIDEAMQDAMPPFEAMARGLAVAEHAAQEGFHILGAAGSLDIAKEVAKKNGAEISRGGYALIAKNEFAWLEFTKTYGGNERTRLRNVALDSRDGFTQNRHWHWDFLLGLVKIDKQGGTDLVNYDAWKAMDSVGICSGLKCRWAPLGWGGAQAYAPNRVAGIGTHGNGANWNRIDGRLARTEAYQQANRLPAEFPAYRDLRVLDTAKTAQQKIPFAVEVLIADTNIPTAKSAFNGQAALVGGGKIEHDPHYSEQGRGVYGLAEACVSFERPVGAARKDGGVERPSLFNPYWRAALATPSRTTRIAVGAVKALPPVEAFFGGAGSCS